MPEYVWLSDNAFSVEGLLTPAEADEYIAFSESIGFGDAPINVGAGEMAVVKDVRNNERAMTKDWRRAADLFERAKAYVPDEIKGCVPVGCNELLRFYRYDPGQRFNWHFDGAYERSNGERSRLTFMVYLNDDFTGGETKFEGFQVKPKKGAALFFIHQIRHQGAEVVQGRKYVIRTDVMYKAKEK